MKIITLSKIGYNAPSGANWAYGIWKLDCINTSDKYCMSYTLKENFGGDSRLKAQVKELLGIDIIETKAVYPIQKITGIKDIGNLEDDKILMTIKEFIND